MDLSMHNTRRIAVLVLLPLYLVACDGPTHPTYYGDNDRDPFPTGEQPPEITAVEPDGGFPGDEIIIRGEGFPDNPEALMVNIGTKVAEILELSSTEMRVRVPSNEPGPNRLRVSAWGAERWSNELTFSYLADFLEFEYDIGSPRGVAVDDAGNLYINSASAQAVYRIDVIDSLQTTFAQLPVAGPMEFGPNGDLYVVTESGLSRISPDGGTVTPVVELSGAQDFDWDEAGRLYVLDGGTIHRAANGSLKEVASVTRAHRMRVFDGHVYVTELTRARVVRFEITADGLGDREVYFNAGTPIAGLDIDAGGNVFAGGFARDYVLVAAPNRMDDSDVLEIPNEDDRDNPFRKVTNRLGIIYLHGSTMYLIQEDDQGRVWRIFTGEQTGEQHAPRYGRD